MNVIPFEKKVKHENDVSNEYVLYSEVIDSKVTKDISKELTKGYIKLLSNLA